MAHAPVTSAPTNTARKYRMQVGQDLDTWMLPSPTVAASFVSSLLEAILVQNKLGEQISLGLHDPPESVDVQILPSQTTAASLGPSRPAPGWARGATAPSSLR